MHSCLLSTGALSSGDIVLSLGMADGAVLPVYMPTSALLHVVSVWFQHWHPEVESQLESRFQLELPVGD